MFNCLIDNNQSYQMNLGSNLVVLLSTTHEIYQSLYNEIEVRHMIF